MIELIDKIMEWKMTPTELKNTEKFFVYHSGSGEFNSKIKDYIFGKYFPRQNRNEYERRSYW